MSPPPDRSLLGAIGARGVSSVIDDVVDDAAAIKALIGLAVAAEELVEKGDDPKELGPALGRLGQSQGFASVALWIHLGDPPGRYRAYARWRAADIAVPDVVDLGAWGMGHLHDSLIRGQVTELWHGHDPVADRLLDMHGDEALLLVPIAGSDQFWGAAMFAAPAGHTEPWSNVAHSCLRTIAAIVGGTVRRHEEQARVERLRRIIEESRHQQELATLAVGVAHDISNLVTLMRGRLDVARMREQIGPDVIGHLDPTLDATAALARQLYAFAGLEERAKVPVDLLRLWRRGLAVLESSRPPGLSIQVRVPGDLPPVRGDVTQVGQALGNLVLNAFEAMEGDSGTLILGAEPEHRGRPGVRVWVQDDGPGVPESMRSRLFEPLASTRGARRGVGLAAARGIVEAHGGELWLDREYTEGARFLVWLPAWLDASDA